MTTFRGVGGDLGCKGLLNMMLDIGDGKTNWFFRFIKDERKRRTQKKESKGAKKAEKGGKGPILIAILMWALSTID